MQNRLPDKGAYFFGKIFCNYNFFILSLFQQNKTMEKVIYKETHSRLSLRINVSETSYISFSATFTRISATAKGLDTNNMKFNNELLTKLYSMLEDKKRGDSYGEIFKSVAAELKGKQFSTFEELYNAIS